MRGCAQLCLLLLLNLVAFLAAEAAHERHAPAPAQPPKSAGRAAVASRGARLASPAPAPSQPSPLRPTNGTLEPGQASALALLGVPLGADPCNTAAQHHLLCDSAAPFRHVTYLQLQYCSEGQNFPASAWPNLSVSLQSLSFSDCPAKQMTLPPALLASLTSLEVINSLGRSVDNVLAPGLTGVWLSKFHNLRSLAVHDVFVNVSTIAFVLANMTQLQQLSFANANLSGLLPASWPCRNLTELEISGNDLAGGIPLSITRQLRQLVSLDLSGSNLSGAIPATIANLTQLQSLKLATNRLRGPIPASLRKLASLQYVDLSGNQLNGSVPAFLARMPALRYVDISDNSFQGPLPFDEAFFKSLNTFNVRGNPALCYNSSTVSAKFVVGLQPCDANGMPVGGLTELSPSPAPSPEAYAASISAHEHRGPKKLVLIVAIALASIIAIIVLAVLLSRCCSSKH